MRRHAQETSETRAVELETEGSGQARECMGEGVNNDARLDFVKPHFSLLKHFSNR